MSEVMVEAGIEFMDEGWTQNQKLWVAQGAVALANKISDFDTVNGMGRLHQLLGGQTTRLYRLMSSPVDVAAFVGLGQRVQNPYANGRNASFSVEDDARAFLTGLR